MSNPLTEQQRLLARVQKLELALAAEHKKRKLVERKLRELSLEASRLNETLRRAMHENKLLKEQQFI